MTAEEQRVLAVLMDSGLTKKEALDAIRKTRAERDIKVTKTGP